MEWFKGKGDLLALIAILLIIFTWLKSDLSALRADIAKKADKTDIARVEFDIKEIRTLLINHISDGHSHGHSHKEYKGQKKPVKREVAADKQ